MGWLYVVLSLVAAYQFYKAEHTILMILALIAAIGSFWSWGVMHNYAMEQAKRRESFTGGFYDVTPEEALSVPDWITWLHMLFSLFAVIMFIVAIIYVWAA